MKSKIPFFILIIFLIFGFSGDLLAQKYPKREFRAGWIQIINGQFQGLSTAQAQQRLLNQLDALKKANMNAVIFQIRAEGDALYESNLEPWSRFLTGQQGKAPNPYWDPLAFMVEECHKRGMELHAWINPYRAMMNINKELAYSHPYIKYPERFIQYGNQLFFDPALQENRNYICSIVSDIVNRYDVDAIHMDDYFYPYPKDGIEFNDDPSFRRLGSVYTNKGDWRRDNVNLLIKQIHETVREIKPWVKFGVSPFGIYRNERSNPFGSRTNGLQNYDDLYADVLLWVNKGWVDYNIPQIYWHVGHPVADYQVLVDWWAKNSSNRPLFIGQSVPNTIQHADPNNPNMNQLPLKMRIQRSYQSVGGSCQWPATSVVANEGRYLDALVSEYNKYPSLVPVFDFMDDKAPKSVRKVKSLWTIDGYMLFWTAPKAKTLMDEAIRYVIYRFERGQKIDLEDPSHIVAITPNEYYKLPYVDGQKKYTYVVTALDRLHNESKYKRKKVSL
ncbi:glycoside hydrolase family 10 protein [Bacteroides coprosuis]|uniref:glycoside hydrolase family 10 protein n=1 Tax=Bacteroides coprosuis TaxID=151276 RepID=UPI001DE87891|nr:family 10 glycosylhydrolase [Bacteroides coprosuis]HJD93222.1 family 10 glycosylhydrolase [Bacteroides coprosuis]